MHAYRMTALTSAVLMVLGHGAGALANTLPDVEISGSSILPSNIENLPGSSSVVAREELDRREPFSVIELLREVPGLHVVSEDAAGTHLNIGLRGLNPRRSSRTLLLEDGAPTVFFAPYGDPSAHYSTPLERLDRVEVLKGSGQILYGPQTLGGMINFVSKPVPRKGFEGSAKLSLGSDGYRGAYLNLGTGSEQGGLMIDLLKRQGDGIRDQHEFDVQDVTIKGQLNINSAHTLTAKYTRFEEDSLFSETGLTAQEYINNPFSVPSSAGERYIMDRDTLQLIHGWKLGDGATLSTQLYYTKSDRTSRRSREFEADVDPADPSTFGVGELEEDAFAIRPRHYTVYGIEPKLEFTHSAFGLRSETVVGMRHHVEDIDRKKFELDSLNGNPVAFEERLLADIEATAFYAQNTFLIDNWTVTPGLRIERIRQDRTIFTADEPANPLQLVQRDSLQTSETETLPGIGFTWNGLDNATLFGGIHKGFAPPRPDRDVGEQNGTVKLQKVTPELAIVTELGVRGNLQAGTYEATLFNLDIEDIVINSNDVFRNEGKARHTGFEVAGRLNIGMLANGKANPYFIGLAYTNLFTAEFRNSGTVGGEGEDGYGAYQAGNRLPYAPKHTLALNVSYETERWNARLGATHLSRQFANTDNFRGTDPQGFCPNGDASVCGLFGEIESVTLVNATVSYRPEGSKVSYFLNAENLGDRQYIAARTNGIQPGRPRQLVAGINLKF
ncbi:MAG TPA: TonB-dependent receptor [Limnobacter sp.]|nr:TonB-dependent receptor [Limnobacter sp.]